MQYECASPEMTRAAGEALGEVVGSGAVLGLIGTLGAGKTLFVQGLARGLGVPPDLRVVSPTFTLINDYPGGRLALHHADLYRLEREQELEHIGLDELMSGDAVVAIEWVDRFDLLPRDALVVTLHIVSEQQRRLEAVARGTHSSQILSDWEAQLSRTRG